MNSFVLLPVEHPIFLFVAIGWSGTIQRSSLPAVLDARILVTLTICFNCVYVYV